MNGTCVALVTECIERERWVLDVLGAVIVGDQHRMSQRTAPNMKWRDYPGTRAGGCGCMPLWLALGGCPRPPWHWYFRRTSKTEMHWKTTCRYCVSFCVQSRVCSLTMAPVPAGQGVLEAIANHSARDIGVGTAKVITTLT